MLKFLSAKVVKKTIQKAVSIKNNENIFYYSHYQRDKF